LERVISNAELLFGALIFFAAKPAIFTKILAASAGLPHGIAGKIDPPQTRKVLSLTGDFVVRLSLRERMGEGNLTSPETLSKVERVVQNASPARTSANNPIGKAPSLHRPFSNGNRA